MPQPIKILVADKVDATGIEKYKNDGQFQFDFNLKLPKEELLKVIPEYHGLVVRSSTQVTADVLEAGKNLKVVGRAGVGVDNIDIDAATRQGVLVMNTPEGNITSAAEHAIALLMTLARKVAAADASMKTGKWDKGAFTGVELTGKTLGLVGLGKVGKIVARFARSLDMQVIAFDPYVTESVAAKTGVTLAATLEEVLATADVVSIHTPLTDSTKGLIDADALSKMKPTALIVNAARGGIIDEDALYAALKEGKLGGAGLDVFGQEPLGDSPLRELDNVVLTPHLGASTRDAQVRVAVDIVDQMVAYLQDPMDIRNAVNMAGLPSQADSDLAPALKLMQFIGGMHRQLLHGQPKSIDIHIHGPLAEQDNILSSAFLVGLLEGTCSTQVNLINCGTFAKERGLSWTTTKRDQGSEYRNLLQVTVRSGEEELAIAGTVSESGSARIVRVNEFPMEAEPAPCFLVMWNEDVPGIIGTVGTILGNAQVNIAEWRLGRHGKTAFSLISVDSNIDTDLAAAIARNPAISRVEVVKFA